MLFNDMRWISEKPEIARVLQQVAFLNINKMLGLKGSDGGEISACYETWKPILFEQIGVYNPDAIIFGGTYSFFADDIEELKRVGKSGLQLIDVYHSAQRSVRHEEYVNDIITQIRDYHGE